MNPVHEPSTILYLTKYSQAGPSSRYRTYQYLPVIKQAGIHFIISPLFEDRYVKNLYEQGHGTWTVIIHAFLKRIKSLLLAYRFKLVIIEYEIFPYFPAVFEKLFHWAGIPYIVDYDDALFHQYDNHRNKIIKTILKSKIAHVMKNAEAVVAGNTYLADYARQAGARQVEIIPTVVNLDRYPGIDNNRTGNNRIIIGWLGSPTTSQYLQMVAPALSEICKDNRVMVRVIGSGSIELPGVNFEILPWEEDSDINLGQLFDIGMMPIPDEPWERGKCGFKLIQYMACGLPVVASPVGVNTEIVEPGVNGFLATDQADWVKALETMINNPDLRREMGQKGRQRIEQNYSLQVTAPRMVGLIKTLTGN